VTATEPQTETGSGGISMASDGPKDKAIVARHQCPQCMDLVDKILELRTVMLDAASNLAKGHDPEVALTRLSGALGVKRERLEEL